MPDDGGYLIEMADTGGLYLAQARRSGMIFWTADLDQAKAFPDATAAQAFADANVGRTVRIIQREKPWATSSR